MDRENYRKSRKGESIIISHQKKAVPMSRLLPENRSPQLLVLNHTWLREDLCYGLFKWQTRATPNGRAESLCWILDKIPLFPILVLTYKSCGIQGLTQIPSKVFFL